jgi:hypothetical protein
MRDSCSWMGLYLQGCASWTDSFDPTSQPPSRSDIYLPFCYSQWSTVCCYDCQKASNSGRDYQESLSQLRNASYFGEARKQHRIADLLMLEYCSGLLDRSIWLPWLFWEHLPTDSVVKIVGSDRVICGWPRGSQDGSSNSGASSLGSEDK